jgi:hypothetical protein
MAKRLVDMVSELEGVFGPGEFIVEEEGKGYDSFSEVFHLCRYDLQSKQTGERLLRDILLDLSALSINDPRRFSVNLGMLLDVWIEPAILTRRGVRLRDVQKVGGREMLKLLESFSGKQKRVLSEWAQLAAQELQLKGRGTERELALMLELSKWMSALDG